MLARIREAEKSQSLAELTQKISSLEYKVNLFIFERLIACILLQIYFNLLRKIVDNLLKREERIPAL